MLFIVFLFKLEWKVLLSFIFFFRLIKLLVINIFKLSKIVQIIFFVTIK